MIVFRAGHRDIQPRSALLALARTLNHSDTPAPHNVLRDALIELGELESGLADAFATSADGVHPVACLARSVITAAARLFGASWNGRRVTAGPMQALCHQIQRLARTSLPASIRITVHEGYAYYGLYPEAYIDAAHALARTGPFDGRAGVIGLRSIGTSLSAAAAAGLEARGLDVRTWTVRPRGHPFNRRIEAQRELQREWVQARLSGWLLVDEGPGLSGSSLAAAAQALVELGIDARRIVLMPHWAPDPHRFAPEVRAIWTRHAIVPAGAPTRLTRPEAAAPSLAVLAAEDWSSGRWRRFVCGTPTRYPAVGPAQERWKWLVASTLGPRVVKFAGLGRYGREVAARLTAVAEAGFGPPAQRTPAGFVISRRLSGRPLQTGEASPARIDRVAAYVAWIGRQPPTGTSSDLELVDRMIRANVLEALGPEAADRAARVFDRARRRLELTPAVRLDGRLQPHEWIGAGTSALKTDAGEHGDDHFLPGPFDVSWDVAGALVEFGWPPAARARFIDRYVQAAHDRTIRERLPACRLAYLAFRVGFTRYAAGAAAGTPDEARLGRACARYVRELRADLLM